MKHWIAALVACGFSATGADAGCGASEEACQIETGSYHAEVPETGPVGAIVFLHGWGSSGQGSLRIRGMVETFLEKGYVVIAPDGTPREGRSGRRWSFHPDWPPARDEYAFLAAVKSDAAERFSFNPDRVLLSGFSIGGSMTSYVACNAPDLFAAYAPIGGGMWRPHPAECTSPVKLFHTHGWSDGTVPLEGRVLRGGTLADPDALIQGDAFATMETWRETNLCVNHKPDRFDIGERYWRRAWDRCAEGSSLEFAMHPGGHAIPRGWAPMALEWFEAQTLSN